jgi:uncharacterized membrane protein (DUF4010 family)
MMTQTDLFYRFGAALVIGTLIGLEREHSGSGRPELFAGVRTFALIALSGGAAALAADAAGSAIVFVAALTVLGLLLSIAYYVIAGRNDIGLTTEVSALLTFLVGALCYWNYVLLAAAIGVVTAALLSFKGEMHRFAQNITRQDIYATLKFAIISAIILPLLPNQSFGPPPFDVLNPYRIWLMVVLISGISFLGYVLIKLMPARNGVGITGLLGGLVSSTAVTISLSERSRQAPALAMHFALSIILAWAVMFLRTPIEIGAVDPSLVGTVWLPMLAAAVVTLIYAGVLYQRLGANVQEHVEFANPFELGPAIKFGLLYAAILLAARAAQLYLGSSGLYLSALFGGAADVTAITLTVAELHRTGSLDAQAAVQALVLAASANTVVKAAIVTFAGQPPMRRWVIPVVPLAIAATLVALYFFH